MCFHEREPGEVCEVDVSARRDELQAAGDHQVGGPPGVVEEGVHDALVEEGALVDAVAVRAAMFDVGELACLDVHLSRVLARILAMFPGFGVPCQVSSGTCFPPTSKDSVHLLDMLLNFFSSFMTDSTLSTVISSSSRMVLNRWTSVAARSMNA
jgi:hypothetical protein